MDKWRKKNGQANREMDELNQQVIDAGMDGQYVMNG